MLLLLVLRLHRELTHPPRISASKHKPELVVSTVVLLPLLDHRPVQDNTELPSIPDVKWPAQQQVPLPSSTALILITFNTLILTNTFLERELLPSVHLPAQA